ncbi:MAG: hypothetical protein ACYTBJ_01165 [Planctomycetota bacterium]
MGLKKRKAPSVTADIIDTHWYGDEHIDPDASDVISWCRTAEADLLKPLPDKKLTLVRYRALTEREHSQLPLEDGTGQALMARCYEACRYGLVSIEGEKLVRRKFPSGVVGLSDSTLDSLSDIRADIPFGVAIHQIYEAMGIKLDDPDTTARETSLPIWLGGQILSATFRTFGDAT